VIAAGLGCRKGCAGEDVVRALRAALDRAGCAFEDVAALYAPEFKAEEDALSEVARQLCKPLVLLAPDALRAFEPLALTHSSRVAAHTGLSSVAETAALAGASALAGSREVRLLGPRIATGGATCALASAATRGETPDSSFTSESSFHSDSSFASEEKSS
jgi:cobalt-precorrin 5A hydrolase